MLRDFLTTSSYVHAEYLRRHSSHPEPLEQPRHGLRRAIGQSLIHLGERLARVEHHPVDEAA
ncbi:MAG TPA: hypothetical protein VF115_05890 [Acidimicrobiia bacterium]